MLREVKVDFSSNVHSVDCYRYCYYIIRDVQNWSRNFLRIGVVVVVVVCQGLVIKRGA
jgi:hypothetical protein